MFSLLSAKDREKLKRMSDSAKQVVAGQSESHIPKMEIDLHVAPESSAKSNSDSEYKHTMFCCKIIIIDIPFQVLNCLPMIQLNWNGTRPILLEKISKVIIILTCKRDWW